MQTKPNWKHATLLECGKKRYNHCAKIETTRNRGTWRQKWNQLQKFKHLMKETHPNYRVSTWPSPWSTALWFWAPFFEVVEPRLERGGVKVRVPAQVNQGNDTTVDKAAFTKPRFSQLPFKATRKRPVPVTDTFFTSRGCRLTKTSDVHARRKFLSPYLSF